MAKLESFTDDINGERFTDDDPGTGHVTVDVNGYGKVRLDFGVASINELLGLAPLTDDEGRNIGHDGAILPDDAPPVTHYTRGELVTRGRGKGARLGNGTVPSAAMNESDAFSVATDTPPSETVNAIAADANADTPNGAGDTPPADETPEPRATRKRS